MEREDRLLTMGATVQSILQEDNRVLDCQRIFLSSAKAKVKDKHANCKSSEYQSGLLSAKCTAQSFSIVIRTLVSAHVNKHVLVLVRYSASDFAESNKACTTAGFISGVRLYVFKPLRHRRLFLSTEKPIDFSPVVILCGDWHFPLN